MFDLKWIRECPDDFDAALARRGMEPQSGIVLDLDRRRREAQSGLQDMQTRRNEASKAIGEAKRRGEDAAELMAEMTALKDRASEAEAAERALGAELDNLLSGLPNTPAADVPDGPDESANVTLRTYGDKPSFDFEPKQHFELGEALGLLDFEASAKLSGSRFVVMRGAVARMHRALAQFMIDRHTLENGYTEIATPYRMHRALAQFMIDRHTLENGYTEIATPYLVRDQVLYGTGQLPKFGDDLFRTTEGLWLIPTAEVPLTNLVAGDILAAEDLPIRVTALTPCFRSEAGSAGKDTRGMLRQHQFDKVEMVSITLPEHSNEELERMTSCAEGILQSLELSYRVVVLSTGDMGFAACKTHDIEVWLPGQDTYREISSCSNCSDFQARRMKTRYRPEGEKGTRFVHTLNGSGVAVGRVLIAVMENHQQADGTIRVPEALRPYMNGIEVIGNNG
jgi:seryl-tRNA synthetase